jgi:hypothetical protein
VWSSRKPYTTTELGRWFFLVFKTGFKTCSENGPALAGSENRL